MRLVHKAKRYHCAQCENSYPIKSYLLSHVRSVHDGKRIKCGKCTKSFIHSHYLARHMKKEHKMDPEPRVEKDDSSALNSIVPREPKIFDILPKPRKGEWVVVHSEHRVEIGL